MILLEKHTTLRPSYLVLNLEKTSFTKRKRNSIGNIQSDIYRHFLKMQ